MFIQDANLLFDQCMEPLLGIAMIRNPFEQTLRQGRDKMKEDKVETGDIQKVV